ncbi:MAG TPA: short-chain fatty acyl-CoA regulator family protein [Arenicellales bacterium]|nr:short-chain fatty acyl-CoA regulator family protein [Arenicellales bacterium]
MAHAAIGYRIREQRKRLGLTQAGLARELGISASYLNLIEANKRSAGGRLVNKLAHALGLEVEVLTGAAEQRLRDDLQELPMDPVLRHVNLERNFADEVVARNPEWARLMLTLYRAYLDGNQALAVLNDRLNRDPWLQASVHRMLTHITTIRSAAEILVETEELEAGQRDRFQNVLHSEAARLTEAAQQMVSFFELQNTTNSSAAAAEQVDEFIIGHRNYFPALEDAGRQLRRELDNLNRGNIDSALAEFLSAEFGVRLDTISTEQAEAALLQNQARFDPQNRVLGFLANAPATTRRFQMARIAAELSFADTLAATVDDPRLSSETARRRATRALGSYIAGAVLLPYERFLDDAESCRYDIEILRQKYDAGYEQVCHRLVTLRDPQGEGVPFAFLRIDPSGYISKRFPLFGFPLPRFGHACPLWPVFTAFQSPGRVVRQLSEFTDGHRFLMIARTVTKRAATFQAQPVMFSVMLACDAIHADRTVYSAGLDFHADEAAMPVGSTCRQCERAHCQHRQEAPVTARD